MIGRMTVTEAWVVPVADDGQVHGAAAVASAASAAAGLGRDDLAACELLATELAANLVRHAAGGRLLVNVFRPGTVQIVAVDSGPGIAGAATTDGRTTDGRTANSPSGGLEACRWAAARFDLYSREGQGTVVLARVGPTALAPSGPIQAGGVISPRPAEPAVGDGFGLAWEGDRMTVGVVDGLGHGVEAAEARRSALELLEQQPALDSAGLLGEIGAGLRVTRGAAAAIARIDGWSRRLTYAGVGDVSARLFRPGGDQAPPSRPGAPGAGQDRAGQDRAGQDLGGGQELGGGARARPHRLVSADWVPPAMLVLHTDGVTSRWSLADYPGAGHHHPAVLAALIWRDARRGDDDAAVVVVRTSPENGSDD